jgi:hypothetical protein
MVDLVHRGQGAGLVGPGAILELLLQSRFGTCLGAADGSDRADVPVVVADPGLRQVGDGLAFGIGLLDVGGDVSPGSDGQRWS